jgi:hypothetical protein
MSMWNLTQSDGGNKKFLEEQLAYFSFTECIDNEKIRGDTDTKPAS